MTAKKKPNQMVLSTPPAEVEITPALIQKLLQSQFPDLAKLPLVHIDAGWDNEMYKLGNDYTIRLPRRAVAENLLKHEQTWLPQLNPELPISIPIPIGVGQPEFGYPWPWSILPWLKGEAADLNPPNAGQAGVLANFLKILHQQAPKNAPTNPHRGVPLKEKAAAVEIRLSRLETKTNLITKEIKSIWKSALEAKPSTKDCWIHGDLHPRNVLVEHGDFTGIIDWGDMTAGDVATDLASIWMLFEDALARQRAIETYGLSVDLLARAKGWAVLFGVVLLETGLEDTPRHAQIGRLTLERLIEDEGK